MGSTRIRDVHAWPTSFPVPPDASVTLGIGRAVKRDAVVVKVTTGGVTEALRIAALASAWKLPIHPHTSMTGLNLAASIHALAAIENAGYFEADVSKGNLFRDELTSQPYALDADGCVRPLEGPGLGLEVDESFLAAHPVIDGPGVHLTPRGGCRG